MFCKRNPNTSYHCSFLSIAHAAFLIGNMNMLIKCDLVTMPISERSKCSDSNLGNTGGWTLLQLK
jgi:hypothetical protein